LRSQTAPLIVTEEIAHDGFPFRNKLTGVEMQRVQAQLGDFFGVEVDSRG